MTKLAPGYKAVRLMRQPGTTITITISLVPPRHFRQRQKVQIRSFNHPQNAILQIYPPFAEVATQA